MSNKPILESGFWETTTFLSNFNFLSIVQSCCLSFMFKLEYYALNNFELNNIASFIILLTFFERSLKPSYLTKADSFSPYYIDLSVAAGISFYKSRNWVHTV